jgi:hypothetical protein
MSGQITFRHDLKRNVAVGPSENHKMAASATGAPDAAGLIIAIVLHRSLCELLAESLGDVMFHH